MTSFISLREAQLEAENEMLRRRVIELVSRVGPGRYGNDWFAPLPPELVALPKSMPVNTRDLRAVAGVNSSYTQHGGLEVVGWAANSQGETIMVKHFVETPGSLPVDLAADRLVRGHEFFTRALAARLAQKRGDVTGGVGKAIGQAHRETYGD